MMTVPIVISFFALGSFLMCAVPPTHLEPDKPLPIRTLAKGAFSGIHKATRQVIRTEEEWHKLWKQHTQPLFPKPKAPQVNFQQEMVLAVTLGQKRTGGYRIEVTRVQLETNVVVSVRKTTPKPGTMTIMALTSPYDFVAVPKSRHAVRFVDSSAGSGADD